MGVHRSEFSTDDPDVAYALMDAAYGGSLRLAGMTGETVRHARQAVDDLTVDHLTMPARLSYRTDAMDFLAVQTVSAGALGRTGAAEDRVGPGQTALTARPGRSSSGSVELCTWRAVNIPVGLLTEVAANEPEPEAAQVTPDFAMGHPLAPAAAEHWRQVAGFLEEAVLDSPAVAASPIVLGSARRYVAATALMLFPNTATRQPGPVDRADARPAALRRAIAHLEAYAHTDLTVADLARAAGVTVRAVQLAFRRHLDTTPGTYLREHRLGLARQDLRAGDPGTTRVAAVAARCGFATPSRFAALYRQRFGELPSRTLARSG